MKKGKIRFFRFAWITMMIVLTTCILLVCFTTFRNSESTSNDTAMEMKAAPGTETKTTGAYGAGHKPSFGQLWSRSEVFMY